MNTARYIKAWLRVLGAVVILGLSACYHGHPHGPPPVYYPYDYYFYPSVGIYFHYSSGYYYYPSHERWTRTRVLPPHILLHPKDRVHLRVESDKPYLKYKRHQQQYKPKRSYQPRAPYDRKEREQNRRIYQKHSQQQEQYKKDRSQRRRSRY